MALALGMALALALTPSNLTSRSPPTMPHRVHWQQEKPALGPRLAAAVTVFAPNAAGQLPGGFICSALGALATGCDALLQGGAASCTRLAITRNLSAASTRALSSCGASVRDIARADEPLHLRWGALELDLSGRFGPSKLKFAILGLREFEGVLMLDWDILLLGAQSWQPRKQPWMFKHNINDKTTAAASPVNAGLLGVQPSLQRELRVLALLQRTFSQVDGWGGPYAEELLEFCAAIDRNYAQIWAVSVACLVMVPPRRIRPSSRNGRHGIPRGRLRVMWAKPLRGASMPLSQIRVYSCTCLRRRKDLAAAS